MPKAGTNVILLGLVLVGLTACWTMPPPVRRAELPFHDTGPPPFAVHWRLDRQPECVLALGVLDVDGLADRLIDATLQLSGIDSTGRTVSRAAALVAPQHFSDDGTWPFRLGLRPTGEEAGFEVRLTDYRWKPIVGGD